MANFRAGRPYCEERRRRALTKILIHIARETGELPVLKRLPGRVKHSVKYQGGVRHLLLDHVKNGCSESDRLLLTRLIARRRRRHPAMSGRPYWTAERRRAQLRPYYERWIASCGAYPVVGVLRREGRTDLLQVVHLAGGYRRLFMSWEPEDDLRLAVIHRLTAELAAHFPKHLHARRFPTPDEVGRQSRLDAFIRNIVGGYRIAALLLCFQTKRDRRYYPTRMRMLRWIETYIHTNKRFPTRRELPARLFRHLRYSRTTIHAYFCSLALDPCTQGEMDRIADRLRASRIRPGIDPATRASLHQAECLFTRALDRPNRLQPRIVQHLRSFCREKPTHHPG